VLKLVHHLDMYVHKIVSKLRTAYFCAVFELHFSRMIDDVYKDGQKNINFVPY
jgi:hypothetical protein